MMFSEVAIHSRIFIILIVRKLFQHCNILDEAFLKYEINFQAIIESNLEET